MLIQLSLQNFTVIDVLELDFQKGMTVFTGETGAGKSIIVDALSLILGARADSKWIRSGAEQADITACFDISDQAEIHQWLADHDYFAGEHTFDCFLRRVIQNNGRSKAYINGKHCPINHLKELGQQLISIHGQHEHHALLQPEQQMKRLDHFGKLSLQTKKVAEQHKVLTQLQTQYEALKAQQAQSLAEKQLLDYQIEELSSLDLEKINPEELDQTHKRLANATSLQHTLGQAVDGLSRSDHALTRVLHQVIQLLKPLQPLEPTLNESLEILEEARINLVEASSSLEAIAEKIEFDPQMLEQTEATLSKLYDMARKHHIPYLQLPEHLTSLIERRDTFQDLENKIEQLEKEIARAKQSYLTEAKRLSEHRLSAATKLSDSVTQAMQQLGMQGGEFMIKLIPLPSETFKETGLERIQFWVQTNPGQPAAPMIDIASGGELSRISLAIQVLTAEKSPTPTLIFDEVDVGISGAIAEQVGKLLKRLSENCQVLCITHLPQVAVQGHSHFQVKKTKTPTKTFSTVQRLQRSERIQAIAELLGGTQLTEQTLAHAEEMLALNNA